MQDPNQLHDDDRKNLILFIVAAIIVWFAFDHFLLQPRMDALQDSRKRQEEAAAQQAAAGNAALPAPPRPRAAVLAESPRLEFGNAAMSGSLSLAGGRIDDLSLLGYYKTHDRKEHVELLSPPGTDYPKYAEFGWLAPEGEKVRVPGPATRWEAEGETARRLEPGAPVTLFWDNGEGLRFEQTIALDADFMFTVTQRVVNRSGKAVTLYPYAALAEHGLPGDLSGGSIVHEGPIGHIGGKLIEHAYRKIADQKLEDVTAAGGWIGIAQNYWLTGLIPDQAEQTRFRFVYTPMAGGKGAVKDEGHYQVDAMGQARRIEPGASAEHVARAYLGAKTARLLDRYEKELGVPHFDLALDFGMYYFLTKPFYYALTWLGHLTGNFGFGIILLTVMVRLAVFPLANTSYKSFAKLKKISPQMQELREKCGGDRQKLQEELVRLYEREKVNPMAGCLPILFQIPIFFALFKVLQISIEMRHAPFFGWIRDLSERDPTSVFNLFGLIPWTPPEALMIGAWPCLMLFFMVLQKYMNPPPQDKTQAMMMNIMPFFMTYILSKYAVGLVIYWTFSNALSLVQQYIIMRNMGVEIHLFSRTKKEKEMEALVAGGPAVHPGLAVLEEEVEEALLGGEEKKISPPKRKKKKK